MTEKSAISVLFIGHTYLTRISQKKLKALQEIGCRVGVLVPSNWRDRGPLLRGIHFQPQRLEGITLYSAPVIRSGHIASHLYVPGVISSLIHSFKPDIVQVEQEIYSYASAQAALAGKVSGKKVIVFGWENLDRRLHITQILCRALTLRIADGIICGNSEGAKLVQLLGYKKHLEVIPQLGIDPQEFSPVTHYREKQFCIGFVGRLVREKGVDILLRAIHCLAQKATCSDLRLVLVGSGPEKENLSSLAHTLQIADKIDFFDTIPHEDVPKMISKISVLVLPSRSTAYWKEQFGHVLIEAMSMGIPVIGSESGAIPEVIGRQDVLFPEDDVSKLSLLLERVMQDQNWYRELSQYGRNRVIHNYTNTVIAHRLLQLYHSIKT